MRESNLYKNLSKQSSSSSVFSLYSRHVGASNIYRELATDIESDNLKSWFSSLADYRQTLANELSPIVTSNQSIPQKNSKEIKPYLKNQENQLITYLNQKNEIGLISLSLEAEEALAKYFQEVESNDNIPIKIRELLKKQHSQTLKVIAKARRLKAVPADQDLSFQLE